jgi:hypothetical protein
MAELSLDGRLERGFGTRGRTLLPTGENASVGQPALEPNGDTLATITDGNMGCWGVSLEMLTPVGRQVPQFTRRLDRFWRTLHVGTFVGAVEATDTGFTLIGTGQKPCYGRRPAPSSEGFVARFTSDGKQVGRTMRFRSHMFGSAQVFADDNRTLFVQSPYANPTELSITALLPDGSRDTDFADDGTATLRTPWRGQNAELTVILVTQAGAGKLVVVAYDGSDNELQLTRLDI